MFFALVKRASRWIVPSSAAMLLMSLTMPSAYGQQVVFGKKSCPAPCPHVAPCPAPAPAAEAKPPEAAVPAPAVEPALQPEQFGAGGGGETFAGAAPNIIGDFHLSIESLYSSDPRLQGIAAAIAARTSAIKLAENESPRPGNRVYFSYNYFHDVNGTGSNLSREMPGFETAFLDGNASFGMRLPIFQSSNDGVLNLEGFGNLNLIGKYAFINNADTGNVLSTGMLLTLPTGRALYIPTATGSDKIRDVILQPFVGYIYNELLGGDAYIQGFSSIAVPTDSEDVTLILNDIAIGYWLRRDNSGNRALTGIVPTLEVHVNTPLNHRDTGSAPFAFRDSVVLTTGSHFIFDRSMLTLGLGIPITTEKPFDVEAMVQYNLRY